MPWTKTTQHSESGLRIHFPCICSLSWLIVPDAESRRRSSVPGALSGCETAATTVISQPRASRLRCNPCPSPGPVGGRSCEQPTPIRALLRLRHAEQARVRTHEKRGHPSGGLRAFSILQGDLDRTDLLGTAPVRAIQIDEDLILDLSHVQDDASMAFHHPFRSQRSVSSRSSTTTRSSAQRSYAP